MIRLRARSLLTISTLSALIITIVTLSLWISDRTANTVLELKAYTLPEINKALSLSEGVARVAGLAPYLSDSVRPYQLKGEKSDLQKIIEELNTTANSLKDSEFRSILSSKLEKILFFMEELIIIVEQELFIKEDLLSTQIDIEFLLANNTENTIDLLNIFETLYLVINSPGKVDQNILPKLKEAEYSYLNDSDKKQLSLIITKITSSRSEIEKIRLRKAYLLASIRAQSELLSIQVNQFINSVQMDVADKQLTVEKTVSQSRILILLITALTGLGLLYTYLFNFRMTRDLESVSDSMTRLASGDIQQTEVVMARRDEIGDLAKSFVVFRKEAIKMLAVTHKVEQQTKLLETIFNQIDDGISYFSDDKRLVAWNRRYQEIFNIPADKLGSNIHIDKLRTFLTQQAYRDLDSNQNPFDTTDINEARLHSVQSFERHYADGRIIEFRSQPLNEGGFITLYRDLSEQRSIENQLLHAKKMEVLGQLTGGVAHDFNNLLAAQLGSLEILEMDNALTDQQRQHIKRAIKVSEKGKTLVQRLLTFSSKQQLFPEVTNINDIISDMQELIEFSINQNITLDISLASELPNIYIDISQLENALLNIFINGSQAMPDGGDLYVKTRYIEKENSVEITITDTGTGISNDHKERIFEPFFTTKPIGRGSGLGLSMVYGFLRQSGGDIQIDSNLNAGSTVTMKLPATSMQVTQTMQRNEDVPFHLELIPGEIILIIEDDLEVTESLAAQAKSLGISSVTFSSAEDAMNFLTSDNDYPSAIITDVNLDGEMSGIELAKEVRKLASEIPILLTSGLPKSLLEEKYNLTLEDAYISKPITLSQLKSIFFD